jgi:hypothetical protein
VKVKVDEHLVISRMDAGKKLLRQQSHPYEEY